MEHLLSNLQVIGNNASSQEPEEEHSIVEEYSMKANEYELGKAIGFGSSGIVYLAKYKPLNGKSVAIKMIDLDRFERNQIDELRKEIQLMTLCKHVNLLPIYASFVNESSLWIVTPFLKAGSCLDIMKHTFPEGFDEPTISAILSQSLMGLDYLHKNNLIHRDIKAGNLLMDSNGLVQLADFGVSSTLLDEGGDRRGVRKTFVGTPCWMAPEVMEMSRGYNLKADIWSFGITAFELFQGHAPYAKYPPMKVIYLTLNNDPPTLRKKECKKKFSKQFAELINLCLQKEPNKRATSEILLKHPFIKGAKKSSYLISHVISKLPTVEERYKSEPIKSDHNEDDDANSWDFSSAPEDESDDQINRSNSNTASNDLKEGEKLDENGASKAKTSISSSASTSIATPSALTPTSNSNNPGSTTRGHTRKQSRFVVIDGVDSSKDINNVNSSGSASKDINSIPAVSVTADINNTSGPNASTNATNVNETINPSNSNNLNQESSEIIKKGRFSVIESNVSSTSNANTSNIASSTNSNANFTGPNQTASNAEDDNLQMSSPSTSSMSTTVKVSNSNSSLNPNSSSKDNINNLNATTNATLALSGNASIPKTSRTFEIVNSSGSTSKVPPPNSSDSPLVTPSNINTSSNVNPNSTNNNTPLSSTTPAEQRGRFKVSSSTSSSTINNHILINAGGASSVGQGQISPSSLVSSNPLPADLEFVLAKSLEVSKQMIMDFVVNNANPFPSSASSNNSISRSLSRSGSISSTIALLESQISALIRENEELRQENDRLKHQNQHQSHQ